MLQDADDKQGDTSLYASAAREYVRAENRQPREDAQVEELRIVPVCIDHTDMTHGDVIFMECGTLGDNTEDAEDKDENQTQAVNTISVGEKEKKEECFDKIYVGFWDGNLQRTWPQMPIPIIDPFMMDQYNLLIQAHCSMRLTGARGVADEGKRVGIMVILFLKAI